MFWEIFENCQLKTLLNSKILPNSYGFFIFCCKYLVVDDLAVKISKKVKNNYEQMFKIIKEKYCSKPRRDRAYPGYAGRNFCSHPYTYTGYAEFGLSVFFKTLAITK